MHLQGKETKLISCARGIRGAHGPRKGRGTRQGRADGFVRNLIVLQPRLWPAGRPVGRASVDKKGLGPKACPLSMDLRRHPCVKRWLWGQNPLLWSGDACGRWWRVSRSGCRGERDKWNGVSFATDHVGNLWLQQLLHWLPLSLGRVFYVFFWKSCLGRGRTHGLHYVDCLVRALLATHEGKGFESWARELRCMGYTKSKWGTVFSLNGFEHGPSRSW